MSRPYRTALDYVNDLEVLELTQDLLASGVVEENSVISEATERLGLDAAFARVYHQVWTPVGDDRNVTIEKRLELHKLAYDEIERMYAEDYPDAQPRI